MTPGARATPGPRWSPRRVIAIWEAHLANDQRILAERRFEQVRRLADSLMFEIHDSVKDLAGSTPTRRLIVSRALEYLDSLAHDAGGNVALQRELATAYEKIGDIQGNPYSANIGDTDGALTSYGKAVQIRERINRSSLTTDLQMELGRSYRALGDIKEQKGEIEQMLHEYRRSLQIFSQLAATDPANPAVQDELARAYETLADGLGRTANANAELLADYKKVARHLRGIIAAGQLEHETKAGRRDQPHENWRRFRSSPTRGNRRPPERCRYVRVARRRRPG